MTIGGDVVSSDSSPWPPPRGRDRARLWLRSGRRLRPWMHGVLAFGTGAVLASRFDGGLLIWMMFGPLGLLMLLAIIAIVAAVFGLLGRLFLGKRSGWKLGWTALIYLPFGVATLYVIRDPYGSSDGDLLRHCLSGAVAASCALIAHSGPPRAAGWLLAVAVIIVTASAAY